MRVCTLGLIAALVLPTFALAAEPKRAGGTETLSAEGFFVASVNVAQLWDAEQLAVFQKALRKEQLPGVKDVKKETGFDLSEIERITVSIPKLEFKRGEPGLIIFVTARKPFDVAKHMAGMKAQNIDEARKTDKDIPEGIAGKSVFIKDHHLLIAIDDRTLALPQVDPESLVELLAELKTGKPAQEGPLAEALALAPKHTLVAAVDFAPVRKLLAGMADVPAEFKPLADMAQAERAVLTADFGAKLSATAKLTFFEAATAKVHQPAAKKMVALGQALLAEILKQKSRDPETKQVVDPILEFFSAALEKSDSTLDGKILTLSAGGAIDAPLKKSLDAFPAWAAVAAERATTTNNLKQIVLAMHNYESANGVFPSDILDKDGKAILSWRVHLLPYLEQEKLYQKFDLTKPWDDKAHKELLEAMPDVFKIVGREAKEKGFTYFQSFSADKAPDGGSPFLVTGVKRQIVSITDGTSNTLAVVDASTAVNWMKPGDLPYDPKKLPKVGKDGWMFASFLDGSVRRMRIPKDDVLNALITINGGEVVTIDD